VLRRGKAKRKSEAERQENPVEVGGSKQIKDFLAEEFPPLLMTWHYTEFPLSRPAFRNLF